MSGFHGVFTFLLFPCLLTIFVLLWTGFGFVCWVLLFVGMGARVRMDPSLRWDDDAKAIDRESVVPAQAGTQRLLSLSH